MTTPFMPVNASCQCGQVSYVLRKPPVNVLACHCQECQKLSTSPFSVTVIVAAADIEFSGEMREWERQSESGNRNIACFCLGCGNRIYHYDPADDGMVRLKLKPVGLDDCLMLKPTVHLWVSEKQPWYEIPEGVEMFQKQPY